MRHLVVGRVEVQHQEDHQWGGMEGALMNRISFGLEKIENLTNHQGSHLEDPCLGVACRHSEGKEVPLEGHPSLEEIHPLGERVVGLESQGEG